MVLLLSSPETGFTVRASGATSGELRNTAPVIGREAPVIHIMIACTQPRFGAHTGRWTTAGLRGPPRRIIGASPRTTRTSPNRSRRWPCTTGIERHRDLCRSASLQSRNRKNRPSLAGGRGSRIASGQHRAPGRLGPCTDRLPWSFRHLHFTRPFRNHCAQDVRGHRL